LTSFGPKSEWEELYFMYINTEKNMYKIWEIDTNLLYNCKVNKTTTLWEQKQTGKRPRLSIKKELIDKYNLKHIYVGIIL
jgi:hypothetical protein